MDIGSILDQIKMRWLASERYELLLKLEEAPKAAATGTEGIMMIGGFLLSLKQADPIAFNEIKDLVDEFAEELAKLGLRFYNYNYK